MSVILDMTEFGRLSPWRGGLEPGFAENAEEPTRTSRLLLIDVIGRTIRQALELLGVQVIDQM